MHEPDVGNGSRHQSFHGRHTESLDRTSRSERTKALGGSGPEAANKETDGCDDVDGPLADFDGEGIADEAADGDGGDAGALEAEGEALERDVEFFGEGDDSRGEERTDS